MVLFKPSPVKRAKVDAKTEKGSNSTGKGSNAAKGSKGKDNAGRLRASHDVAGVPRS